MAIAAEHLIQVFYTHGSKLEQSEVATDVSKYLKTYILHRSNIDLPRFIYLDLVSKQIVTPFLVLFGLLVQFGFVTKKTVTDWLCFVNW